MIKLRFEQPIIRRSSIQIDMDRWCYRNAMTAENKDWLFKRDYHAKGPGIYYDGLWFLYDEDATAFTLKYRQWIL